jgi:hypothetical protein
MKVGIEPYKVEEKTWQICGDYKFKCRYHTTKTFTVSNLQDLSNVFHASGSIRDLRLLDYGFKSNSTKP